MTDDTHSDRLSTGVQGLDKLLHGGLIPRRGYMVRGEPGCGKTILGLHFLTTGAKRDESTLFVNLEEEESDIRRNAETLGFDLDDVAFLDLSPTSDVFTQDRSYDIFDPEEVKQESVTQDIIERIEEIDPDRVVVDPVTQLRYLISDEHQFRKQITAFIQFLKEQEATVLFTSQISEQTSDDDLQFISHGVITLRRRETGRTVEVPKLRGSDMEGGRHAMRITDDGLVVYPRLTPGAHRREFTPEQVSSGVPEIDEILNGGIERGTVTLISGPTGVGKTTLGAQFMKEAAGRGERSVVYQFEESRTTFMSRCANVNIPVQQMIERDTLQFREVEPLTRSVDEFAQMVREEVEEEDARIVMIDGTEGYRLSLRGEGDIVRELHALCRYLKNMGVTVILVVEISDVVGDFRVSEQNVSYIADNILFLRYLEVQGEIQRALGVLKKRMSDFEQTLREFQITEHGIKVGEPLTNLRGVLSGTPEFVSRDDGER
jgi:circadian clock protein KaiC